MPITRSQLSSDASAVAARALDPGVVEQDIQPTVLAKRQVDHRRDV
jgi:hypothetical protein